MLFCLLLTFFKANTYKNIYLRNTIIVSYRSDPDQDRHSVGPDLSWSKLFAATKVGASKERVSWVIPEFPQKCFFCLLLTFFKANTCKNIYFRNTIIVSYRSDPDQDRHSVGPDLSWSKLFAATKVAASKKRVSWVKVFRVIPEFPQKVSLKILS